MLSFVGQIYYFMGARNAKQSVILVLRSLYGINIEKFKIVLNISKTFVIVFYSTGALI